MENVKNKKDYYTYYLSLLNYEKFALEYAKYLKVPSLCRLKQISYFCYVDYGSKEVFDFKEPITRFDHSITTALLTQKFASSKVEVLAALFHDIATPCFSHVIDFLNEDYTEQESTEEYTEEILKQDRYLLECLKEDKVDVEDLIHFKQFSLVDIKRPKLCADRLDGVILPGISWSKNITKEDIYEIVSSLDVFQNEEGQKELGFTSLQVGQKVLEVSDSIDFLTHSSSDYFMMNLLVQIVRLALQKHILSYESLYFYTEEELIFLLQKTQDSEILSLLEQFFHCKKEEVKQIQNLAVKKKILQPLVLGKRLENLEKSEKSW